MIKSAAAGRHDDARHAVMLAACALSAVLVAGAVAEPRRDGTTVGSFVAFISAMLMLVAPLKHLSDVMGPSRAAWRRSNAASTWSNSARRSKAAPLRARRARARRRSSFDDVDLRLPRRHCHRPWTA